MKKKLADKEGNIITIKELAAIDLVSMLISTEIDDNTKLRAFQIVRDTIGEAPPTKSEVTGKDGQPIDAKTIVINILPEHGEHDGGNTP